MGIDHFIAVKKFPDGKLFTLPNGAAARRSRKKKPGKLMKLQNVLIMSLWSVLRMVMIHKV